MPVGIAEAAGGVVGVLEVAAGGPRAPQRSHQLGRLHPVAGLGVDRHGHVDAPGDPRGRGEHLVARRTLVVLVAERARPRRRCVVATTGNPAATTALAVATSQAFGSRRGSPGRCSDRSRSHRPWRSVVGEVVMSEISGTLTAAGCHPAARVKRSAETRSPSRQTL